jgi:hypothetical protein
MAAAKVLHPRLGAVSVYLGVNVRTGAGESGARDRECDQASAHPQQKAAKDEAPPAWLCQRKAGPPADESVEVLLS